MFKRIQMLSVILLFPLLFAFGEEEKKSAEENPFIVVKESMYYQGFYPSMEKAKEEMLWKDFVPYNTQLVGKKNPIRDAEKSFELANKARDLYKGSDAMLDANLIVHYISGIGTKQDYAKALELLLKNYVRKKLLEQSAEEIAKEADYNTERRLYSILAYMYYKGIGLEKNLDKCKAILQYRDELTWRNFYMGCFAPYDREFAIFMLENFNIHKAHAANVLYNIYSGNLNPDDVDEKKASEWQLKFEVELELQKAERIEKQIDALKRGNEENNKIIIIEQLLQKRIMIGRYWNEYKDIDNPFYNPELAEKMFFFGTDDSFRNWKILYILNYKANGDSEDTKRYYEIAKEKIKSPSEAEELERSFENCKKQWEKDMTPSYWFDNLKK